jgi:hypothetical protein
MGFKVQSSIIAICAVFSGPAYADITNTQVWGDMRTQLQEYGYNVQATVSQASGTLAVEDMILTQSLPEGDIAISLRGSAIDFVQSGPNRVDIQFPERMKMQLEITDGSQRNSITFEQRVQGNGTYVQDRGQELHYVYDIDTYGMSVVDTNLTDLDMQDLDIGGFVTIKGLQGTMVVKSGDTTQRTTNATMERADFAMTFDDPSENTEFDALIRLDGMTYAEQSNVPYGANRADVGPALAAGMSLTSAVTHQGLDVSVRFNDAQSNGQFAFRQGSGEWTSAISPKTAVVQGGSKGIEFDLVVPETPLPVSGRIAGITYNMDIPIGAAQDEQSFDLAWAMQGLTLPETVWSIFDPIGALDRSPLDLALNLSGAGVLGVNLFDLEQMGNEIDPTEIGQLNSLALNNLTIAGLGARLLGQGEFTLDNNDLRTFDGFPRPEGRVTFTITGLNKALDDLVRSGLVPSDQVFMGRMMMGAFLTPTGDDELTSDLEVKSDGSVYANGQRLR